MTNKTKVSLILKELCEKIDGTKEYGITATDIADKLELQRNLVSHLLNDMSKGGKAIKISKRPVYFMDSEVYESRKSEFRLISEYLNDSSPLNSNTDKYLFKELVGSNGSLKYVVQQCKSAVAYPPNGLPFLLVGESGVGKSFIAQLVFDYAKHSGFVKENAPFVIFNCAEYANNPELFSAILFGASKGAYTGADMDRVGLIEKANGGYLFLDEIHRLPPEGQEKLFLFLDKGIFRRVGEAEKKREANVRMIFATTENPENQFLQTFLRRIPLIVKIPTFQDRPLKERKELIKNFYRKEAVNINKDILVSSQVISILINNNSYGNIGKLTNTIKLSCASALSSYINKTSKPVKVKINNLPKEFINQDDDIMLNKINVSDMFLSCSDKDDFDDEGNNSNKVLELTNKIVSLIENLKSEKKSSESFMMESTAILNELIDDMVFSKKNKDSRNIIFNSMEKITENTLAFMRSNFGINYFGNSAEILTYILTHFLEKYDESYITGFDEAAEYLSKIYSKDYKTTLRIIENIENNLGLEVSKIAVVYVLIYIKSLHKESNSNQINAVIITHGYSTASSIAGVANRMLGRYIFEPFDMPLESSVLEISNKLKDYTKTIDTSKGLLILVDMGSLESIYISLKNELYGDIAIIDNVSTRLALDVGNRIHNCQPLEQIAKETVGSNICKYNFIPSRKRKEDIIITTCITGIGTASKLKDLLNNCFKNEKIKVLAYDFDRLKDNGREDFIFKQYNVKLIIGTNDPKIADIPYISLENLIMRKGNEILINTLSGIVDQGIIDKINRETIKLFTLENVLNYLTILNPDKIVDQVEQALIILERELGFKFQNDLKISLYIHISCMVERLVVKDPIMTYKDITGFEQCHVHFVNFVRKAFSVIEQFYKVKIPISEIGFIYDSIKNKVDDFQL
ncbi:MAG: hypothetical protein K0R54_2908 [Clostridiaceae bacterium]|jgi:sigma-54 dependent transcriptional regulator of gfr operon|nr:hypothetical protein [Clostridiaceae bacterium]